MTLAFRCITFEIAATFCIDQSPGSLEAPGFEHPFVLSQRESLPFLVMLKHLPWLTTIAVNPSHFALRLLPEHLRTPYAFRHGVINQIDGILKNPEKVLASDHESVYKYLLSSQGENPMGKRDLTRMEMIDEAMTIILAGTDTVANAATRAVFYVLNKPSMLKRLTSELRDAWPDVEVALGYTELEKLPYLVRSQFIPYQRVSRLLPHADRGDQGGIADSERGMRIYPKNHWTARRYNRWCPCASWRKSSCSTSPTH